MMALEKIRESQIPTCKFKGLTKSYVFKLQITESTAFLLNAVTLN